MSLNLIPKEIANKVVELGYTNVFQAIKLYSVWSVVVGKGEDRFNINLSMDGNYSVLNTWRLDYIYNQWGSRILNVNRTLVRQ